MIDRILWMENNVISIISVRENSFISGLPLLFALLSISYCLILDTVLRLLCSLLQGKIFSRWLRLILAAPSKCTEQIRVLPDFNLRFLFRINTTYFFYNLLPVGMRWNYRLGEFVKLLVQRDTAIHRLHVKKSNMAIFVYPNDPSMRQHTYFVGVLWHP